MKDKRIGRLALCLLIVSLLMQGMTCMAAADPERAAEWKKKTQETAAGLRDGKILDREELLPAGSSLSDWAAFSLALAGEKDAYSNYEKRLKAYVTEMYEKKGCLSDRKATEYHRTILTVLALGADPYAFGTDPDGTPIDLIADGTYAYEGDPGLQGVNGWIFALIALDAAHAEVPADAVYSREVILEAIRAAQNQDGSFGLMEEQADADMTSMALQALAPYQEDPETKETVERAVSWLSEHLTEHGAYESYEEESAESCAQAVIALTALGIDPETDERFVKNGVSLLDGMELFRRETGGYAHTADDPESNFMATEQVLMAQVAMERFYAGEGSLYSFEGYEGPEEAGNWMVPAVLILAAAGVIIFKRRGKTNAGTDRTDSK